MPKFNGNIWNMSACNRLVNERIEGRRHARHVHALEHCRAMTDHTQPKEHPHLRSKPKTKKLQEDRAAEIQLENRILLQKMLNIDTKPSQFSSDAMTGRRAAARSLHGEAQRRELDRITNANQDLLKRLQNARASINPHAWDEEEMDRQALKFRLSQNSCRGRSLKLPMPHRSMAGPPQLPRIGGRSDNGFREDDWARLTNKELDQKLLELESGSTAQQVAQAQAAQQAGAAVPALPPQAPMPQGAKSSMESP